MKPETSSFKKSLSDDFNKIKRTLQTSGGYRDDEVDQYFDQIYKDMVPAGILRIIQLQKEGICSENEALVAIEKLAQDANVIERASKKSKPNSSFRGWVNFKKAFLKSKSSE
jgi:cell division septum initiation protein DivIVA